MTIYICTINLFLLFDNTTGMTHLKITRFVFPLAKSVLGLLFSHYRIAFFHK